MNQVQQNFLTTNTFQKNYQRPVAMEAQLPIKIIQVEKSLNSKVSIKAEGINQNLMGAELVNRNINEATSLVQSVQEAAVSIESELFSMKNLAMQNGGCTCQAMRNAQESIRDISKNFSWNGENFIQGGGENNQNTTLRNFTVATGGEAKDDLQIGFKSFNPMSAVDTDGNLEPSTPNLPDLNKTSGTDTHAFGDSALYSSLNEDAYLHTHTNAMKKQAIIQINRAIDGIKSERERLSGFLKKLNNISETNQNKNLNENEYKQKILNGNQANEIAMHLTNKIQSRSFDAKLSQLDINATEFERLLN